MLIQILDKINNLNEAIFEPADKLVEALPFADWAIDAICDSIHLLPFLFFVFLIIELLEFYWADKINHSLKQTGKYGILVGSVAAIFPQCGFSVIASSLYSKRIITRGCLIAVYLATSDETIPILLAIPQKAYLIIPIVGIKLFLGILVGYLIDWIMPQKNLAEVPVSDFDEEIEEGCCKHDIEHGSKRELIIHPIMHTLNEITNLFTRGKYIQIVSSAFLGLIPNCAISIGLTMMLIKGTISFAATMSGLLSNAGLGLLVLLKNNDFKDTLKIILILLVVSILSGFCLEYFL